VPVIALSRYRAQLGRGRRVRRADVLFDGPDPGRAIRALPRDEFYYVIQEIGFPEAMEVFLYASPEQIQTVLDFDVWDRDLLSVDRAGEWMAMLAAAPYEIVGAWMRNLDVEIVALLLRKHARIYDLSEGEPPDSSEGEFFTTPDGLFALELLGSDDTQRVTRRLVDSLYRYDRDWMRRLLLGTMGDLDAELEETSYRWRSGRMADLGFEDYYDALEVYRELDPSKLSLASGEGPATRTRPEADSERDFLRVPMALAERLAGSSPFARAIAGITKPEDLAEVHQALVLLSNRVLAADRVAPGDEKAAVAVLARVAATLDLAVEFLAKGSDDMAVASVRRIPLVRLFQLGTTLIGKARKLALTLRRENLFTKRHPEIDLFEAEDAEIIEALARLRPLVPRRLDNPPPVDERPFGSLIDLACATAALERAAAATGLLYAMGVRPEHLDPEALTKAGIMDPTALDTGSIARTWLVERLVGEPADGLRPLTARDLKAFRAQVGTRATEQRRSTLKDRARKLLEAALPSEKLTQAARDVIDRWVASLEPLGPVLTARDLPPGDGQRRSHRRNRQA
jgi:hypothetical protein